MPSDPLAAARWWMKIQKPPDEWADKPKQISVHGKDGMRWITPYADRLKHNLELFLRLQPTDQQYIVGAAEDGVYWRGDQQITAEILAKVHIDVEIANNGAEAVEKYSASLSSGISTLALAIMIPPSSYPLR